MSDGSPVVICCPAALRATVDQQSLAQGSGEDAVIRGSHCVWIDLGLFGHVGEILPRAGSVDADHARSVRADEPLVGGRNDGGYPVLLQCGIRCGETGFDNARFQDGQAAQRAYQQPVLRLSQGICVVVHQSVKGIEAAGAAAVNERESGGRGHGETIGIHHDVRDVIRDQTVGAEDHLFLVRRRVEQHQTVGGAYGR